MNQDNRRRRSFRRRIAEFVVEVIIAISIVGVAVYHADHTPPGHRTDLRWIAFVLAAAITFGYPAKWHRLSWRQELFSRALGTLLAIHVVAYSVVLFKAEHFAYLWFAIVTPLEWILIYHVCEWSG